MEGGGQLGRPLFLKIMAREVNEGRKGSLLHREGVRANGDDGLRRSPKSAKEQICFQLIIKEEQSLAKINFIEGSVGLELRSSTELVKIGSHNVARRMQLPRATTMARSVSDTITLGERRNLF